MFSKSDSKSKGNGVPKDQKGNFKNKKNFQSKPQDDSTVDDDSDIDLKISKDDIQYNMPKPGPHAKAGEWRKWKMMKRAIRQEREEKRIIKRKKQEEQQKAEEEYRKLNPEVKQGRKYTVSIAIPGSIMGKVQSKELKTYVAGQIGRAATLFCIDEIIVYNEYALENKQQNESNEQLIKILEYMECPQYLRKVLFPPHKYLEHVGLLHPLEAPHHFKINDDWEYREGVVTDIATKDNKGSWVDIGLTNKIQIDKKLQSGVRVTVKKSETSPGKLKGLVVSPETPRLESGKYWGYQVRYANAFRKLIYESSFQGGYDLKIGINLNGNRLNLDKIDKLPAAKRVLIVFGGLNGIEAAIEADEKLKANKIEQIFKYFCESDRNVNIYGSRSVRLEEAILISLAVIRPKIVEANQSGSTDESNSQDESMQEEEQENNSESEEENFKDDDGDDDDDEDEEDAEDEEEENGKDEDQDEQENDSSESDNET